VTSRRCVAGAIIRVPHATRYSRTDPQATNYAWVLQSSTSDRGPAPSAPLALHLGGVPDVASAREIRAELVAARDARHRNVVLGARARALGVYRTGRAAAGPPLALLRTDHGEPRYLISLAGTVLVDWPFPEVALAA